MEIVTLELIDASTAQIFKNLYPLYLHDLSAYHDDAQPNQHGILEDDDSATLEMQMLGHDYWLSDALLQSFLIRVAGRPAGFALVTTPAYAPNHAYSELHEFFLLHPFRARGLAGVAAQLTFAIAPGSWILRVLPRNEPALRFWRKTLLMLSSDLRESLGENEMVRLEFAYPQRPA